MRLSIPLILLFFSSSYGSCEISIFEINQCPDFQVDGWYCNVISEEVSYSKESESVLKRILARKGDPHHAFLGVNHGYFLIHIDGKYYTLRLVGKGDIDHKENFFASIREGLKSGDRIFTDVQKEHKFFSVDHDDAIILQKEHLHYQNRKILEKFDKPNR